MDRLRDHRLLQHLPKYRSGRVYLAKDSGLEPELVTEMYPRFAEWKQIRKKYSQIPPKVEYSLTKHAIKLRPIIEFLSGWNKEISSID